MIDVETRGITTFAINRSGLPSFISGEGGFGSPVDVKFGPDGAMYILDLGIPNETASGLFIPSTGVIYGGYQEAMLLKKHSNHLVFKIY